MNSPWRYLSARAAAALLLLVLPWAGHTQELALPNIGDSSGALISPEEERRLGEAMIRNIRQSLNFVDDPEVNDYVNALGYRLASQGDNPYQTFTFFVLSDPQINAFAAPGGFIGVNSGLILAAESESEVAAVLAHEIAHVTQRHLARTYEQHAKLSLPTLAALVAAIVIGSQNAEAGQAALALSQAGAVQAQLNFSRGNEEEADRVGIQALSRAGFDPRSMPAFFERLQKSARYYGNRVPEFLSTHPVTVSRIADSRNRAEQYPYRQVADSLSYELTRSRLRLLEAKDAAEALRYFDNALNKGQYRSEDAARYGHALALLGAGRHDLARAEAERLLARDPDRVAYRLAMARIEARSGRFDVAERIYREALKTYPNNVPLTVAYASGLLQEGKAVEARALLSQHVRQRTAGPAIYKLLATAEGETGHPVAAHVAMAEYYYLNGHTRTAVEQLRLARALKSADFYVAAGIDARLDELRLEIAQREADGRDSRHMRPALQ